MTMYEEERPKTLVQWVLGNQCNYKCSYCHEMFYKGDRSFPSEELIAEVCKDIVYHFDNLGRDVVFEFIGGEPTLSGDIKEIGKRLHNHPTNIVLKTNGSADLEWWRESKKYLSHVIISVHKEFCDLNHLDEVVKILLEDQNSHPISVEILIPSTHQENHWNWAISTHQHFQTKFKLGKLQMLFVNFTRGSDTYYPYSEKQWHKYAELNGSPVPKSLNKEEEKEQIRQEAIQHKVAIPTDVKIRDRLNFQGMNCYAGIDTLTIDYNGRIWRGWCAHGGPIGSIYELPIEFPKDPIVCGLDRCSNGFDQQARKVS